MGNQWDADEAAFGPKAADLIPSVFPLRVDCLHASREIDAARDRRAGGGYVRFVGRVGEACWKSANV
jgi:hypothetical protein